MPSQFKSEDVEQALLKLLQGEFDNVDKIASSDVNDGNLIAPPPATRLLYDGAQDTPLQGPARRSYNVDHSWIILCGARNLRDQGPAEDTDAKAMVSEIRAALAGVRLTLADGNVTEPIALAGAQLQQFDGNGCWYAQRIIVSDVAQFDGGAALGGQS
jgi:hypothetical protein